MVSKSQLSRLFITACFTYGAFLLVLQHSLRGNPHSLSPKLLASSVSWQVQQSQKSDPLHRDQLPESPSSDPDHGRRQQQQQHQHPAEVGTSESRKPTSRSTNATISIRGLEANSVLMRKLKESRQQLASKMKTKTATFFSRHPPITAAQRNHGATAVPFIKMADDVYVYSAILDRRFRRDYVRVFALCPSAEGDSLWRVTCHFNTTTQNQSTQTSSLRLSRINPDTVLNNNNNNNNNNKNIQPSSSVVAKKYAMCENHGKKYGGWILTCPVPDRYTQGSLTSISLSLTYDELKIATVTDVPLLRVQLKEEEQRSKTDDHVVRPKFGQTHHENHLPKGLHSSGNNSNDKDVIKFNSEKNYARTIQPQGTRDTKSFERRGNDRRNSDSRIGVCVPPLHGDVDLTRVVNFVEMSRILGAGQVLLYINDISPDMRQMLHEYLLLDPAFLRLVDWNLPVVEATFASSNFAKVVDSPSTTDPTALPASEVIWNRGQLLAIQHCLYTNMDAFDWLLFMDVDEMLFPRNASTWNELFREATTSRIHQRHGSTETGAPSNSTAPDVVGLVFQSAIFHPDSQSQAQYDINYFQKMARAKHTDRARSKLAVRPDRVFEMGIHHLSRAITHKDHSVQVPPDTALVHHYREDHTHEQADYFQEEADLIFDSSSLKYQSLLSETSQSVMRYLGKRMIARRRQFPMNQ